MLSKLPWYIPFFILWCLTATPESWQERQEEEKEEGQKGEERRQGEKKGKEAQETEFKFELRRGRWEETQVCEEKKNLGSVVVFTLIPYTEGVQSVASIMGTAVIISPLYF